MPKAKSFVARRVAKSGRGTLTAEDGIDEAGFALPIVLALLILLTAVAAILTSAVKSHIRAGRNYDARMHARVLAESALAAVTLDLRRGAVRPQAAIGANQPVEPVVCTFDNSGIVAVQVRDPNGRIDLNFADVPLLEALFAGLGVEPAAARQIVDSIDARRSSWPVTHADQRLKRQPPSRPFDTEEAIRQITGVSPRLAMALTPYITVHSSGRGVDIRAADPALVSILQNGGFDISQSPATRSARLTFIVTIAARSTTGGNYGLEAVLRLTRNQQSQYGAEILVWKPSIFVRGLTPPAGSDGPPCLTAGLFSPA